MQVGPIGSTEADKVPQTKETEAGAEISALVNYVQPVHFSSFENSESKCRIKSTEGWIVFITVTSFTPLILPTTHLSLIR